MDIVTLGAALNGSAEYVNSHFKGGSNIQIVDNPDGTQTINASGEVSSEDTVARAEIAAIKDGETLDSFGDVETALGDKADLNNVYSKLAVDTALSNKADKSTTYTKTEVDTALNAKANTADVYSKSDVDTALGGKVDKETGKGLSTNDYTTAEKQKLAGVEAQANKTIVDDALSDLSTNPVQNKVIKSALDSKANTTDIPTVPITAIQKNGTGITPVSGTVNITVPTTAADVSALPDTTKYAAALSLTINSSTFVMTGQLKDQNGDNLGTAQTIDLPLESVVVGGSYNNQTKKVVLTLQNGNTIEFSVADLVAGLQAELSASNKLNPAYINYDSTHRAVSDTEKASWNGKQSALDSTQLAAVNSGATTAKIDQIEVNKNNISSLETISAWGVQTGVKNMAPISGGTKTGSGYFMQDAANCFPTPIKSGTQLIVSFHYTQTTGQGSVELLDENGSLISGTVMYTTSGQQDTDKTATITLSKDAYGYNANYSGTGTMTISNLMIRPAFIEDSTFAPYAPSNAELYAMIQALQS